MSERAKTLWIGILVGAAIAWFLVGRSEEPERPTAPSNDAGLYEPIYSDTDNDSEGGPNFPRLYQPPEVERETSYSCGPTDGLTGRRECYGEDGSSLVCYEDELFKNGNYCEQSP